MALAQVSDIEALAGRSLTTSEAAYASTLLDKATSLIQGETRQTLTAVSGDVWMSPLAHSREGAIRLPQRPVKSVSSVNVGGNILPSTQYAVEGNTGVLRYWGGVYSPYPVTITVTYDHGFDTVPEDLVAICAELVWGQLSNPQGLRQFALGDYSGTFAGEGAGIGMALTSDHLRQLSRYTRKARTFRLAFDSDQAL